MNLQPPTEQADRWFQTRRDPLAVVAVTKGFCEGLGFAQTTEEELQSCSPETIARIHRLSANIQRTIGLLERMNLGSASDELSTAARAYTTHDPQKEPYLVLGDEAAVQTYLTATYLASKLPLQNLYACERFAAPPIIHCRGAVYALMLREQGPKAVTGFLASYLSDDRQLMQELMTVGDPDICQRLRLE